MSFDASTSCRTEGEDVVVPDVLEVMLPGVWVVLESGHLVLVGEEECASVVKCVGLSVLVGLEYVAGVVGVSVGVKDANGSLVVVKGVILSDTMGSLLGA